MKKYLLAAVAALAIGGTAHAFSYNTEARCMRDGPGSAACEYAQQQHELENLERRQQDEDRARAQWCMFHRC
jgi:peptidoglycan hydrolase CwlO-like protein